MARISLSKIKQVEDQSANARTRMTKWDGDLSAMLIDPKGGDAEIVKEITAYRDALRQALRALAEATPRLERARTIVENRKAAKA